MSGARWVAVVVALAGCAKVDSTREGGAAGRALEEGDVEPGDVEPVAPLPPEVQFGEAVRAAHTDAALAFVRREKAAAEYIAMSRAVSGKLRLAKRVPDYLDAWAVGDADGDLVPDDRDGCPDTRPARPTGDDGCEVEVDLQRGPRDEEVLAVVNRLGFAASPDCAGAPIPQTPRALKSGYDNVSRQTFAFALSPVTNQPEGCAVYYEVRVVMTGAAPAWDAPVNTRRVLFRDREATERSTRLVFRISGASTGEAAVVFQRAHHHTAHALQVRAMNGAGQVSGWSPLVSSSVSFGEP